MKLLLFVFVISVSLQQPHATESGSEEKSPRDSDAADDFDEQKRSRGGYYFNCKGILRKLFAVEQAFQNSGSNVVCSPVSALLPLGKLAFGAENPTRAELLKVIGERKKNDVSDSFKTLIKQLKFIPGVTLDLASRIYVSDQAELLPKFSEAVKEVFHSSVEKISFKVVKQAADEINGWVSRQTNGMIPLLLKPSQISPMASLVIVNAIYFKGKWQDPFVTINVGDFFTPTAIKKAQLMTRQGTYKHTKSDVLNAQIIEIPYEGMEAAFVIVLPNEKVGLSLLLNQLKLAPNLLNSAMKKLQQETVEVTIPKFTITSSLDLKDMYDKIGLKQLVGPNPGLTGLVKGQNLTVSSAIQKAVIEVHETGTEASAASATVVAYGIRPPPPVTFRADHPFLFYVQTNGEQLFAGIFNDP